MKSFIFKQKNVFLLVFLTVLLSVSIHGQNNTIRKSIYFDVAKFDLSSDSKSTLDQLIDSLKYYQNYKISIYGNCDNIGDSVFNFKLSEKRVSETQQYFVSKMISPGVFSIFAYGEEKPIADNSTDIGKQKNRRVDIIITFSDKKNSDKKENFEKIADIDTIPSIFDLFSQMERNPEEFYINPTRDTALRCQQGTIVYIKANALKSNNKGTNDTFTIKIKEDFLKSDMVLDNLTTTSYGKIIESAGMVHIEVFDSKGIKINRARNKGITILLPTKHIQYDMKIFKGKRASHNKSINWKVQKNSTLNNIGLKEFFTCYMWYYGGGFNCPFLFCKIKLFFQRLFRIEPTRSPISVQPNRIMRNDCENLRLLLKDYGITNYQVFNETINKDLMKKFNVKTTSELIDTLEKRKAREIELSFMNKTIKFEDYKYYIFNTSSLDWVNCDAFVDIAEEKFTLMKTNLKVSDNVDCKIIFKYRRIIISANSDSDKFEFNRIPKGEDVWVVAIKYENGQPYLFMEETNIEDKTIEVEFKSVTLEELKIKLKELDY